MCHGHKHHVKHIFKQCNLDCLKSGFDDDCFQQQFSSDY